MAGAVLGHSLGQGVGVDGLIIVDLPPEEDEELCIPAQAAGLNFIPKRPELDVLRDYQRVIAESYAPKAYFARVLRVGTAANMPPLNMLDKSGVPIGLDVDLASYMASAMGVELSLVVSDRILKTDIQYEESIQTHINTIEKDITVDLIEPGEIFGWSALIKPGLFTTTARCSKAARIISLPADKLKAIFDKNPRVGYGFTERLAEIISQRLRNRTDKLIESWNQAFDVGSF